MSAYGGNPQLPKFPKKQAHCVALGGNLASINSLAEQNVVDTMLLSVGEAATSHWTWFGFNDRAQEGVWVWSDG